MTTIMFALTVRRFYAFAVTIIFFVFNHSWADTESCSEVCNWYSNIYPLCESQDDQWGWENSQSCIGRNVCNNQWGDGGVVKRCEEKPENNLCETIEGRTYYSNNLTISGFDGEDYTFSRRLLNFSNGEYVLKVNGNLPLALYPKKGTYTCENNQLIAVMDNEIQQVVEYSSDLSRMHFSINGWSPAEGYRLESEENADCSLVQSGFYQFDGAESVQEPPWISFGIAGSEIELNFPGEKFTSPHLGCESGSLLVNRTLWDANPLEIKIEESGARIVAKLSETQQWQFTRDAELVCGKIDRPVCSIVPEVFECSDEPCPSGRHHTFSNRCQSDISAASFLKKGSCGNLEGQPYFENTGTACSGEYEPVCAAKASISPCLSSPCPIQTYKTYTDMCDLRSDPAKVAMIHSGECEYEGSRVLDNSDKGLACAAVYQPVCAKDEGGAVCVTEPCNTHIYKTFGNLCEANVFVTDVVWSDADCGSLEGALATQYPPVQIVDELTEVREKAKVNSARIENNQLFVDLVFTGCSQQNFELEIANAFAESMPVQGSWALVPAGYQQCQAEVEVSFVYDLLPLKTRYEQLYGDGPATISLPGLINYEINQK